MATQYTIRPGDTLSGIGARFGVNWRDLASWNNIANPNLIYSGRTLNLSGQSPSQSGGGGSRTSVPTPTDRTAFSKVLPFERVFDADTVTGLAEQNINPEIDRKLTAARSGLESQLGSTGMFRTGLAQKKRQDLMDSYERMRKEMVSDFTGQIKRPLTEWYNRQSERYYTNPSAWKMPTLPTYEEYITTNPLLQPTTTTPTQPQPLI